LGTILVVDDNVTVTEAVKSVLETAGYECNIANSGKDCISLIQKTRFDLVLLDLEMSQMSGIGVLEKLANNDTFPYTKIVFFTGSPEFSDKEIQQLKKQYGVIDHLSKPFTTRALLEIVERYVH